MAFKPLYILTICTPTQIYSEITMTQKDSKKQVEQNVDKMLLLLATVYESARLLPAGPLLQRCSLDHGNCSFLYYKLKMGLQENAFCVSVHVCFHEH